MVDKFYSAKAIQDRILERLKPKKLPVMNRLRQAAQRLRLPRIK